MRKGRLAAVHHPSATAQNVTSRTGPNGSSGDVPPGVPWRNSLIYELHVKVFTQRHPGVHSEWRGKYLGLTAPEVIGHYLPRGLKVSVPPRSKDVQLPGKLEVQPR